MDDFDWVGYRGPYKACVPEKPLSIIDVKTETPYERKERMLIPLSQACLACSMCELGLKIAARGNICRDPHVFSNMRPHRFVVVGQNPGWTELEKREPFVGDAGATFDGEVQKHGMSRDDFYICNTVRCFTQSNERPNAKHIERCEPFLRMELNLIKPKLIIALGAVAFQQLCPGHLFSGSFKKLIKSEKYGIQVLPIYHPSPLNLNDPGRLSIFQDQIHMMCELVKAIKKKYGI